MALTIDADTGLGECGGCGWRGVPTSHPVAFRLRTGLELPVGKLPSGLAIASVGRVSDVCPGCDPSAEREYAVLVAQPRTLRRRVPGGYVDQRVGSAPARNDPCPCGSGAKYKRCCG